MNHIPTEKNPFPGVRLEKGKEGKDKPWRADRPPRFGKKFLGYYATPEAAYKIYEESLIMNFYKNSNIPICRGVGLWKGKWEANGPKGSGRNKEGQFCPDRAERIGKYDYLEQAKTAAETFEKVWIPGTDTQAAVIAGREAATSTSGITPVPTETVPQKVSQPPTTVTPLTATSSTVTPLVTITRSEDWKPDTRKVAKDIFDANKAAALRAFEAAFPTSPFQIDRRSLAYHFSIFLAQQCGKWDIVLK